MTTKFIVLIPVLNGEATLADTLATCCSQNYADYRILVSDNWSDDRTEEIVRFYQAHYDNIDYVKPDKRLGMSAHWESALGRIIDEECYLIVLGADDALLPGALRYADALLNLFPSIRALAWGTCYYHYPDLPDPAVAGRMMLRMGRNIEIRDSRIWLQRAARGQVTYQGLANIYHGFVATSVLRKLAEKSQRMILSMNPDIYLSLCVCCLVEHFAFLCEPLSLNVISGSSNGFSNSNERANKDIMTRWLAENDRPWHSDLPYSSDLMVMHAECLLHLRDATLLPPIIDIDLRNLLGRAVLSTYSNYPAFSRDFADRMTQIKAASQKYALENFIDELIASLTDRSKGINSLMDLNWYLEHYDYVANVPCELVKNSLGAALYAHHVIEVDESAKRRVMDLLTRRLAQSLSDSGDAAIHTAWQSFIDEVGVILGPMWLNQDFLADYLEHIPWRPPPFDPRFYFGLQNKKHNGPRYIPPALGDGLLRSAAKQALHAIRTRFVYKYGVRD